MNTKQIGILVVLVVVVGFGGLWFSRRDAATWSSGAAGGQKLLANLPIGEALAQVVIRQGTNELNLVKQADRWQVRERSGYPANYAELSSAVLKLRELKAVQTEPVGASQLGRLELLPPGPGANTATLVEFRDAAGKVLDSLLLGKTQMRKENRPAQFGGEAADGFPAGRWVMSGGAKDVALLVADPLASFTPKAEAWLNKDFFKVEKIKAITVTFPEATNSWSVSRESESVSEWTLADARAGEVLDSGKTSGFGWALANPTFIDVVSPADSKNLGFDQPVIISLQTFDGLSYTLKVGAKQVELLPLTCAVSASYPKNRPAAADEKPEDKDRLDQEFAANLKRLDDKLATEKSFESWTYLISTGTLDALLKPRGELLKTETAEKDATPPTSESPGFLNLPAAN